MSFQQYSSHPEADFKFHPDQQNSSHYDGNMFFPRNERIIQPQIASTRSRESQQRFIFKKSSNNKDLTTVHLIDAHQNSPPHFSISTSTKCKPNITLFRGEAQPCNTIGTAMLRSTTSKTDVTYQGQEINMKTSLISGNHTVNSPRLGRLKWTISQFGGSSLELRNEAGSKLARYGSERLMGNKQLQIFIPCDDYFIGFVLLSAMTCNLRSKVEEKGALDVVLEVLGAV